MMYSAIQVQKMKDSASNPESNVNEKGSFGGLFDLKDSEVERIDFEDYHAIIVQSTDEIDGLPVYGAKYYWRDMFLFYTPIRDRRLDGFRKYVQFRIKSINCIQIDENRFVRDGHIYHFKNFQSKSN